MKRGYPTVRDLKLRMLSADHYSCRTLTCVLPNFFCKKLDGYKYDGVFKFGQPVLLIRDPELIKTVLVKEFNSFHDNDFQSDPEVDPLFSRNPFVLTGER
jgi:hypothetical protein